MTKESDDRKVILEQVAAYYQTHLAEKKPFVQGDRITYAARCFDEKEMVRLVDSALDFWLTSGRYAERFERKLAEYLGVKCCAMVNSGSSANLLAFAALTVPELGERAIQRGDEVITVAAAFPTTVTPIVQYGAVPVFVDITIPQYNMDIDMMKNALSPKTKAVMIAHTLGNPFDVEAVKAFCDENRLWLIEDNCDALGSKVKINGKTVFTGTVGDIGTSSFYPPHHITTGEGGAVYTNNEQLMRIVNSLRDWGKDCHCPPGTDNACGKRFGGRYGELPFGYDHKYVFSHFGYNLKATEMQAAIGCEQMDKLDGFIQKRKANWDKLYNGLVDMRDVFVLPEKLANSEPSWFGFLLTLKEGIAIDRKAITDYLESKNIQTRTLFSGNLIKHPCFDAMRKTGQGYRISGNLSSTDIIMERSFWVGVYPGMTDDMLDYIVEMIKAAVKQ